MNHQKSVICHLCNSQYRLYTDFRNFIFVIYSLIVAILVIESQLKSLNAKFVPGLYTAHKKSLKTKFSAYFLEQVNCSRRVDFEDERFPIFCYAFHKDDNCKEHPDFKNCEHKYRVNSPVKISYESNGGKKDGVNESSYVEGFRLEYKSVKCSKGNKNFFFVEFYFISNFITLSSLCQV